MKAPGKRHACNNSICLRRSLVLLAVNGERRASKFSFSGLYSAADKDASEIVDMPSESNSICFPSENLFNFFLSF